MGMNNHMHKGRPLKMPVISVGKVTHLVATELKTSMRCHLLCPP